MLVLAALIGISLVFYLIIPGVGAFWVRARWRKFRNIIINSRYFPLLTSENLRHSAEGDKFRFLGTLEAIEDGEIIWLQGDGFRVPVSMHREEVYILTGHPLAQNLEPGQVLPQRMAWDQMLNLAEGTQFFVYGSLVHSGGRHVFASTDTEGLLVVVYDGEPEQFVSWAVWSGRQQNEFWNFLTPATLLIGSISYLLFTLYLAEFPIQRFWLAVGLTGALIPVLPLFPPGIFLYFVYRSQWRQGRKHRADRDVLALPLLYFLPPAESSSEGGYRVISHLAGQAGRSVPSERLLPDGTVYVRKPIDEAELKVLADRGMIVRLNSSQQGRGRADGLWGEGFGLSGMQKPKDLMAEFVGVRWDPIQSVILCQKTARRNEIRALAALVLALGLNLPLVGWILWQTLQLIR